MAGEFTYESYASLLEATTEGGYECLPVREYLRREDPPDRFVVLRHDVDRKPENALDMAQIEADAGVTSTYYFRTVASTFDPEILRAIADLGHEVGYHYEDVDRAEGDLATAHEAFAANLARVREHVTVDTVSMHGNPLTPYDNRDMWVGHEESTSEGRGGADDGPYPTFADYDLLGEVYLSVDFSAVTYFTDTNRTWYDEKTMVNDWPVGANGKSIQVETTADLIDLLASGRLDRLYVLAHPDRWTDSPAEQVYEATKDAVFNAGKWGLYHLRRLRDTQQGDSRAETRPQSRAQSATDEPGQTEVEG